MESFAHQTGNGSSKDKVDKTDNQRKDSPCRKRRNLGPKSFAAVGGQPAPSETSSQMGDVATATSSSWMFGGGGRMPKPKASASHKEIDATEKVLSQYEALKQQVSTSTSSCPSPLPKPAASRKSLRPGTLKTSRKSTERRGLPSFQRNLAEEHHGGP